MKDQNTPHFNVNGNTITASGSTMPGQSDYFYGQNGASYTVTITGGANLFNTGSDASGSEPPLLNGNGTPYNEVVYMTAGTFTNNGTLTTYPQPLHNAATNYHKSPAVVLINNQKGSPSQVTNNGTIGDFPAVSDKANPFYSYDQENDVGVFIYDGTVTNNRGATISGFNAVFTKGNGTLNNYGTLLGSNDGALTAYVVNNYAGASLSNGVAGFACIHAYNTVNNYGYMLGQDYGILADGHGFAINDFGGPAVPGVKNFDGSQVYNGEISALQRGSELPRTSGPYMTMDAIMLDTNGSVVNLNSTTVNGVVYLPLILGPMDGGFNGDYSSPSAHVLNTLNFNFTGITAAEASTLQTAVAQSYKSGPNGNYYSGSVTINGMTYHWEDFAHVTLQGTTVQGILPTVTPKATATATAGITPTATSRTQISTLSENKTAGTAVTDGNNPVGPGYLDIGLIITGLLVLLVLGVTIYRLLRKRLRKQRIAAQTTQVFELETPLTETKKQFITMPKTTDTI